MTKQPHLENAAQMAALFLCGSLFWAAEARAAGNIEIVSPPAGVEFALDRITLAVTVSPDIAAARVTTQDGQGNNIYDSGERPLQRGSTTWSPEVPLVPGLNRITVSAAGAIASTATNFATRTDSAAGAAVRFAAAPVVSATIEITRTQTESTVHDARETFGATFYNGLSIDTFAGGELKQYAGQSNSGNAITRYLSGFDFEYRVQGNPATARGRQLWVYGETVHGVRSSDVDCGADPPPAVCDVFNVTTAGDRTLFLLRTASSLEAFLGARWEFLPLQLGSEAPARLYLKAQFGFLAVAERGSDAVDMRHIGLGAVTTSGRYRGSYLEIGWGRNDLFAAPSTSRAFRGRFLIDAFLNWHPDWMRTKYLEASPFVQFVVDSDLGPGSDSVQTYIGFQFDLAQLFGR